MLLYIDNIDGCAIGGGASRGGLSAQNVRWVRGGMTFGAKDFGGDGNTQNMVDVAASALHSGNHLTFSRSYAVFSTSIKGIVYAKRDAANTSAAHVIGGAIRFVKTAGAFPADPVVGWNGAFDYNGESVTVDGFWHDSAVLLNNDGTFSVAGNTSSYALDQNVHAYLEVAIDPSAGTVDVYINDTLIVSGMPSGLTNVEQIGFMIGRTNEGGYTNMQFNVDDIYVLDDTGDDFNARLGPIRVNRLPLDSQDSVTFTPQGAPTNLDAVNKTGLSTASYNQSGGANDVSDLYRVDTSGLDPDQTILGVIVNSYAARSDLGNRGLNNIATDGSNTKRQDAGTLATEYQGAQTPLILPKAPDDSSWSIAKIDATSFGYEVTAG